MRTLDGSRNRRPCRAGVAALLLVAQAYAGDDSNTGRPNAAGGRLEGLSVSGGRGTYDTRAYRAGLQWRWRDWHAGDVLAIRSYFDAALIGFDASHLTPGPFDDGPPNLNGIVFAPVFRGELVRFTRVRPFVELAVGATWIDETALRTGAWDSKRLGSHFQFEDRFSIGLAFGPDRRFELAYQRMHYSNADLADDNEGMNSDLLMFGMRF